MEFLKSVTKLGFVFVILLLSSEMTAQDQTPRATSAESMANRLTRYEVDQLKLDAKEAKDLKEINFLYAERLLDIRRKAGRENSKREEEEALKRSHSLKIRSILSSEKYQQYLALKKEDDNEEDN
jgi:hypothetical protein